MGLNVDGAGKKVHIFGVFAPRGTRQLYNQWIAVAVYQSDQRVDNRGVVSELVQAAAART